MMTSITYLGELASDRVQEFLRGSGFCITPLVEIG